KLHLIVCVMRQRDGRNFLLARDLGQKFVPQFSRRHLNGNLRLRGERFHIRAAAEKLQPQFCRRAPDEFFIRLTGASAKLVIEMRHGNLPAIFRRERMECVQ
ncbi:MAG: hypothetical protein RL616_118, partial [Verrucomicrobiota bacterium]